MKPFRLTAKAETDLLEIDTYLSSRDSRAADRILQALLTTMKKLAVRNTGRYGRIAGTYEKSVTDLPYVVIYHFVDAGLEILRVIHTSRDWPKRQ